MPNDLSSQLLSKNTSAPNHDLDTDAIIRWLTEASAQCEFSLSNVEGDGFTMTFQTIPKNLPEFCASIYAFCPDTVDQHYGCFKDLFEGADEIPDEMKVLVDGVDFSSDDHGLKIMERDILLRKTVVFWWD